MLSVIFDSNVVFDDVGELDRQSLWRVEDQADIMGAVLISRLQAQFFLLANCRRQCVARVPYEVRIEQINPVLLQRSAQRLPGVQVAA